MPFRYRAVSANCGNDTLGIEASAQIAVKLDVDFLVVNCQEVAYEETKRQLQAAVGPHYKVICPNQMTTHTKLSTQFHFGTGVATFVIHKIDLEVEVQARQLVRRSVGRLSRGGGYNKGGLSTEFVITKNKGKSTQESIRIQAINGHLDSFKVQKRTIDWHKINQLIAREDIKDWQQLVAACPNLRLSGYDANTRNKFNARGEAINLWDFPDAPEIQALYQAPVASQHYSTASTYKTQLDNIEKVPDKKRPGYARGGMLDFVGVADGNDQRIVISVEGVTRIPAEQGAQRDHDVLISPLREYVISSEFDVVKGQIASRLQRAAPSLAQDIMSLEEDNVADNKTKLLGVYQLFLKKNGLLNNMIALHAKKLASLDQLKNSTVLIDNEVKKKISAVLFPKLPWFESITLENMVESAEKYVQKMQLTQLLLHSLDQCQSESGFEHRLDWYHELIKTIENNTYNAQDAIDKFKTGPIDEYLLLRGMLKDALDNYQPTTLNQQIFKQNGLDVLAQVTLLAPDEAAAKMLNAKSLSQLTCVVEQSKNAIDALNDHKKDIKPIIRQLTHLSQEVSGKSSTAWRALGGSLLAFSCIALVVVGVLAAIPSGGTSLLLTVAGAVGLTGVGVIAYGSEKGLAKSISAYKAAIYDLAKDENMSQDDNAQFRPTKD